MVDYLAAKIGIGEAAHRDPAGLRVRSPSQKDALCQFPIATKVGEPETPSSAHGRFRNLKTAECGRMLAVIKLSFEFSVLGPISHGRSTSPKDLGASR